MISGIFKLEIGNKKITFQGVVWKTSFHTNSKTIQIFLSNTVYNIGTVTQQFISSWCWKISHRMPHSHCTITKNHFYHYICHWSEINMAGQGFSSHPVYPTWFWLMSSSKERSMIRNREGSHTLCFIDKVNRYTYERNKVQ